MGGAGRGEGGVEERRELGREGKRGTGRGRDREEGGREGNILVSAET